MSPSAAAAGAGGWRLPVGVKLSTGEAYPGNTLFVLKKAAACMGFQVLYESAGVLPVCLGHTAECGGDAGIAFRLGGFGIKGTALIPDGMLIRSGGAE